LTVGPVGGNYTLTKAGAGLLILGGNNTYNGATTINAGTLQVGNGGAGVGFASLTVGGAGTMAFNNDASMAYAGTLNNGAAW